MASIGPLSAPRPALHGQIQPQGRDHLPGVVLKAGAEVALQHLRAQRLGQALQLAQVPGAGEVGIVVHARGNEGARLRPDGLAAAGYGLRPVHLGLGAVDHREPAQGAGRGRIGMAVVQPGGEIVDHPAALGAGRRVEGEQGLAALARRGGAQPAEQEQHLG
ncbi:MAG TPA: hypothetical protein VE309_10925, partial [Caulobacteraceae bacterium]|nr:hypothetical protein [Caulobacteraceae bacterium]